MKYKKCSNCFKTKSTIIKCEVTEQYGTLNQVVTKLNNLCLSCFYEIFKKVDDFEISAFKYNKTKKSMEEVK